jgi:hypothetical protein
LKAYCHYSHEPGYTEPICPNWVEEGETISTVFYKLLFSRKDFLSHLVSQEVKLINGQACDLSVKDYFHCGPERINELQIIWPISMKNEFFP